MPFQHIKCSCEDFTGEKEINTRHNYRMQSRACRSRPHCSRPTSFCHVPVGDMYLFTRIAPASIIATTFLGKISYITRINHVTAHKALPHFIFNCQGTLVRALRPTLSCLWRKLHRYYHLAIPEIFLPR